MGKDVRKITKMEIIQTNKFRKVYHRAVLMHFEGFLPAALCDLDAKPIMAELVGAKESEVQTKHRPDQLPHNYGSDG